MAAQQIFKVVQNVCAGTTQLYFFTRALARLMGEQCSCIKNPRVFYFLLLLFIFSTIV